MVTTLPSRSSVTESGCTARWMVVRDDVDPSTSGLSDRSHGSLGTSWIEGGSDRGRGPLKED